MKEICEAFEELQQKNGEYIDRAAAGSIASNSGREDGKHPGHHKIDPLKDDAEIPIQREIDKNEGPDNEDLERSSPTVSDDVKDGILQYTEHNSSPALTVNEQTKASDEGAHSPNKGSVSNTTPVPYSSPVKREIFSEKTGGNGEDMTPKCGFLEAHSKGSDGNRGVGLFDVKEDSPSGMVDAEDAGSPPLAVSFRTKKSGEQRVIMKTHGKRKVVPESMKRGCAVEVKKKMRGGSRSLKNYSSDGSLEHPESSECVKDEIMYKMQGKITSCSSVKERSPCASKPDDANTGKKAIDVTTRKKAKSLPRGKKQLVSADNSRVCDNKKTTLGIVEKGIDVGLSSADCSKNGAIPTNGKHKMATTDDSHPAKRSRPVARGDDTDESSALVGRKTDSTCTTSVEGKVDEPLEMEKSKLALKAENHGLSKTEARVDSNSIVGDEAAPPLTKQRRALEGMSDCSTKAAANAAEKGSGLCKNDKSSSGYDRSPTRSRSRRRSCFPFDEEDETQCKTPVHRGSASILKTATSKVSDANLSINLHQENHCHSLSDDKDFNDEGLGSTRPDDRPSKDRVTPVKIVDESLSSSPKHTEEKRLKNAIESHVTSSPRKQESKRPSSDSKPALKDLPGSVSTAKAPEHKIVRPQVKPSSTSTAQKMQCGSSKVSGLAAESVNRSSNLVMAQRNKPTSSSEKLKATPKTISRMNATSENRSDHAGSAKLSGEKDILHGERYVEFVWLTYGSIIDNGLLLLLFLLSYCHYVLMFVFCL